MLKAIISFFIWISQGFVSKFLPDGEVFPVTPTTRVIPLEQLTKQQRLWFLVDFLENFPHWGFKFDLGAWGGFTPCGTIACAFGWAHTIPELKKLGLYKQHGTSFYLGHTGFFAATRFFGISESTALEFFTPSEYRQGSKTPPKVVGHRIRTFLEDNHVPHPYTVATMCS